MTLIVKVYKKQLLTDYLTLVKLTKSIKIVMPSKIAIVLTPNNYCITSTHFELFHAHDKHKTMYNWFDSIMIFTLLNLNYDKIIPLYHLLQIGCFVHEITFFQDISTNKIIQIKRNLLIPIILRHNINNWWLIACLCLVS